MRDNNFAPPYLPGRPLRKLASRILACPGLLLLPEPTLRRNHDAILTAVGDEAAGKLLVSRRPDVLAGAVDRVERNLRTLRAHPFSCSATAAVKVLHTNARLAGRDLEQAAFAARVAYWQQAYKCPSAGACTAAGGSPASALISSDAGCILAWC